MDSSLDCARGLKTLDIKECTLSIVRPKVRSGNIQTAPSSRFAVLKLRLSSNAWV